MRLFKGKSLFKAKSLISICRNRKFIHIYIGCLILIDPRKYLPNCSLFKNSNQDTLTPFDALFNSLQRKSIKVLVSKND